MVVFAHASHRSPDLRADYAEVRTFNEHVKVRSILG
jgi:hypothetical protein